MSSNVSWKDLITVVRTLFESNGELLRSVFFQFDDYKRIKAMILMSDSSALQFSVDANPMNGLFTLPLSMEDSATAPPEENSDESSSSSGFGIGDLFGALKKLF